MVMMTSLKVYGRAHLLAPLPLEGYGDFQQDSDDPREVDITHDLFTHTLQHLFLYIVIYYYLLTITNTHTFTKHTSGQDALVCLFYFIIFTPLTIT